MVSHLCFTDFLGNLQFFVSFGMLPAFGGHCFLIAGGNL